MPLVTFVLFYKANLLFFYKDSKKQNYEQSFLG